MGWVFGKKKFQNKATDKDLKILQVFFSFFFPFIVCGHFNLFSLVLAFLLSFSLFPFPFPFPFLSFSFPFSFQESLAGVLKSLMESKDAWPFLEPVDPDAVEDYYEVIKNPIGLLLLFYLLFVIIYIVVVVVFFFYFNYCYYYYYYYLFLT